MNTLSRRLSRLERCADNVFSEVLLWIAEGRFYDGLSQEDRNLYALYYGLEKEVLEEMELYFHGNLHFPLKKKIKPSTESNHAAVKEVETFFDCRIEEYKSPAAVAKREADYQELCRIGRMREAEFKRKCH